jgi:hypothetical protein
MNAGQMLLIDTETPFRFRIHGPAKSAETVSGFKQRRPF